MSPLEGAPPPPDDEVSGGDTSGVLIELCAGSVDDGRVAAATGVQRIELNAALPLGGLTPTGGLLQETREAFSGPVICMIRPREGGFVYSASELRVMWRDAEALLALGADGLVTGFLTPAGQPDRELCRRFRDAFPGTELVFHRAIDLCADPVDAARQAADCGFERILSSGGGRTAVECAQTLRRMAEAVGPRTKIVAGGGIRANNVRQVLAQSGLQQIHTAVRTTRTVSAVSESQPARLAADPMWCQHGEASASALRALIEAASC